MVHEYEGGWTKHLLETLWAYQSLSKTATGLSPFFLVYGTEAVSPVELLVPTPRVIHGQETDVNATTCAEIRTTDLETLEEIWNFAYNRTRRYQQQMANAYNKATKSRVFVKGQMVLKAADHIKRNLSAPSKFALSWEGPYLIREASASSYYHLATAAGGSLMESINGKWLKLHYAHLSSMYLVTLFCMILNYYYANKN